MYILTQIEYEVLKAIYENAEHESRDPILFTAQIENLQCHLDQRQVEVAINAMVVFNFVNRIGRQVAITPKGVEAYKNSRLLKESDDEVGASHRHSPEEG